MMNLDKSRTKTGVENKENFFEKSEEERRRSGMTKKHFSEGKVLKDERGIQTKLPDDEPATFIFF